MKKQGTELYYIHNLPCRVRRYAQEEGNTLRCYHGLSLGCVMMGECQGVSHAKACGGRKERPWQRDWPVREPTAEGRKARQVRGPKGWCGCVPVWTAWLQRGRGSDCAGPGGQAGLGERGSQPGRAELGSSCRQRLEAMRPGTPLPAHVNKATTGFRLGRVNPWNSK